MYTILGDDYKKEKEKEPEQRIEVIKAVPTGGEGRPL